MKLKKLDSHFRGNDEVEVTRNLKQAKPNELDSHFRGNDGMQVRGNDGMQVRGNDGMQVRGNDVVQVSVWMDSSFPRRRESRSVGAETYRVKRFLEILRLGFPLSWE
ncbi:pilus assembly protein PilS [Neisseria meningitidis]|nr:pilus assembly protein PilS [Neisseria meningitidis]